ncbi:hypothetical protein ACFV2X_25425, partial [Streptomyces sp. NPDC059679]|uniref:hypothetical protein n=1 Tax=Streptomyces sp. NPDC059679 TaxID=3346903 RepID=UPI0036A52A95
ATSPQDGRIFRYDGDPDKWTEIGGPGAEFAVSNDRLYGMSPDHSTVYQWTGKDRTSWTALGDPLK